MGNETSTFGEEGNLEGGSQLQSKRREYEENQSSSSRIVVPSYSVDSDDDEDSDSDIEFTDTKNQRSQQSRAHNNNNSHTPSRGGSFQANVAAAVMDKSTKFVDPVLSAAAAGAVVRQEKLQKHRQRLIQQQKLLLQQRTPPRITRNEWKTSLKRLANAAASTATSVAHVTAPVLADAGSIVVESAKEFASDVQQEFKKETPMDDESIIKFYPQSPARSTWSKTSWSNNSNDYNDDDDDDDDNHNLDLLEMQMPPKTNGRDLLGRVSLDLNVTRPTTNLTYPRYDDDHHDDENDRNVKRSSERSVQIPSSFGDLDRLHNSSWFYPQQSRHPQLVQQKQQQEEEIIIPNIGDIFRKLHPERKNTEPQTRMKTSQAKARLYRKELEYLQERKGLGGKVDEKRIYCLELYERRASGEDLLMDELHALHQFEKEEEEDVFGVSMESEDNDDDYVDVDTIEVIDEQTSQGTDKEVAVYPQVFDSLGYTLRKEHLSVQEFVEEVSKEVDTIVYTKKSIDDGEETALESGDEQSTQSPKNNIAVYPEVFDSLNYNGTKHVVSETVEVQDQKELPNIDEKEQSVVESDKIEYLEEESSEEDLIEPDEIFRTASGDVRNTDSELSGSEFSSESDERPEFIQRQDLLNQYESFEDEEEGDTEDKVSIERVNDPFIQIPANDSESVSCDESEKKDIVVDAFEEKPINDSTVENTDEIMESSNETLQQTQNSNDPFEPMMGAISSFQAFLKDEKVSQAASRFKETATEIFKRASSAADVDVALNLGEYNLMEDPNTKNKYSSLFAMSTDSLYEAGDNLKKSDDIGVSPFDDPKSLVKSVLGRIDKQETKRESKEEKVVALAGHKSPRLISDSMFLSDSFQESLSALSPLTSPPSIPSMTDHSVKSNDVEEQGLSDDIPAFWDFVPEKRKLEIGSTEVFDNTLLEPYGMNRIHSVGSYTSISSTGDPVSGHSFSRRRGRKSRASIDQNVPNPEDMNEGRKREKILSLFSFSSLENIDFLKLIPRSEKSEESSRFASILWRQLLSNWKHTEMWKLMLSRPCSVHFRGMEQHSLFVEDDSLSSSSTIRFQFHNRRVQFSNSLSAADSFSVIGNLGGFKLQALNDGYMTLTGYLCDIGPASFKSVKSNEEISKPSVVEKAKEEKPLSVAQLLKHAESYLDSFSHLVKRIVEFSSQDDSIKDITFAVGLKNYSSIKQKAARKYGNDIMQVKDVLRGQITFPNEASLVCGLYFLHNACTTKKINVNESKGHPEFEIIRLKNLFRTSGGLNPCHPPTPTGYRHILINIRIGKTIIAELQFQLAQFFGVMGSEGYTLYKEIVSVKDPTSEVGTTDIVRSIVLEDCLIEPSRAMETAKVTSDQTKSSTSIDSRLGGSEIVAAAAKAKDAPLKLPTITASRLGGGGIAAAAAAAAAKKKNSTDAKPSAVSKAPHPISGGGIAAAAAAAAAAKKTNSTDAKPSAVSKAPHPISGGGIAAAAAAAAAAKATSKMTSNTRPQLGGGGIAAAAAAAAARKKASKPATSVIPSQSPSRGSDSVSPSLFKMNWNDFKNEEKDLLSEMMRIGSVQASQNSRDLPSFFCLFLLAKRLEDLKSGDAKQSNTNNSMQRMEKLLLLRSLAISNQASSFGMVGWLEYGSSNPLERTHGLSFELLHELAYNLASNDDWLSASDVLSSLVLRCEQVLPSYHPILLSSMLDMSAALSMTNDHSLSKALVQRVADLVAVYLTEQETTFFDTLQEQGSFEKSPTKIFLLETRVNSVSMLRTFADTFKAELSRKFLSLVGPENRVKLFNHSLVADSYAVLANCISAGARNEQINSDTIGNSSYWSLAYIHYQYALKGWIKVETLSHPNAAATVYSIARCLREMGRVSEALKVLGLLTTCLQKPSRSNETDDEHNESYHIYEASTFLSPRSNGKATLKSGFPLSHFRKEQTLVLCLWMTAVLTVEDSPDERGRARALSLLHKASDTLRHLLEHASTMDEQSKRVCFELYDCVEQEARILFQPLQSMDTSLMKDKSPTTKVHISLTQMRQRRHQFQSVRPNTNVLDAVHLI